VGQNSLSHEETFSDSDSLQHFLPLAKARLFDWGQMDKKSSESRLVGLDTELSIKVKKK
jgi:hypothetical protein